MSRSAVGPGDVYICVVYIICLYIYNICVFLVRPSDQFKHVHLVMMLYNIITYIYIYNTHIYI